MAFLVGNNDQEKLIQYSNFPIVNYVAFKDLNIYLNNYVFYLLGGICISFRTNSGEVGQLMRLLKACGTQIERQSQILEPDPNRSFRIHNSAIPI